MESHVVFISALLQLPIVFTLYWNVLNQLNISTLSRRVSRMSLDFKTTLKIPNLENAVVTSDAQQLIFRTRTASLVFAAVNCVLLLIATFWLCPRRNSRVVDEEEAE